MAERRGRIPKGEYPKLLANFLADIPVLYETIPLFPAVSVITSTYPVSAYDAIYVALADRQGCELVTADTRLLNNLQRHYPFILPLSSLP